MLSSPSVGQRHERGGSDLSEALDGPTYISVQPIVTPILMESRYGLTLPNVPVVDGKALPCLTRAVGRRLAPVGPALAQQEPLEAAPRAVGVSSRSSISRRCPSDGLGQRGPGGQPTLVQTQKPRSRPILQVSETGGTRRPRPPPRTPNGPTKARPGASGRLQGVETGIGTPKGSTCPAPAGEAAATWPPPACHRCRGA